MENPATYNFIVEKQQDNYKNYFYLLAIFVVWPFGSFLYSLWNYNKKESLLIFVLFTGLFSYSMQSNSSLYDLERVLKSAELYASKSDGEFYSIVTGLYGNVDDAGVDIYMDLVSFIVTRFSNNGHILLMVFGLIYGFLYTKCISSLLKINNTRNFQTGLILLCFSMIFGMDQIAGIRFATASYMFFYGLFNYFRTSNLKYIVILALSSMIHFSYISLIVLFLIYILTKPSEKLLYFIVIISAVAGTFFQGSIGQLSSILGGSIEARTNLYLGVEGSKDSIVWFVEYKEELIMLFVLAFVLIAKISKNKIVETVLSSNLFKYSLFVLILSNLTSSIPDAGFRFLLVFIFIFTSYVYVTYNSNYQNNLLNKLYSAIPFFFILQIFFASRAVLFYSPLMLFYDSLPMFVYLGNKEVLTWDFIISLL